MYTTEREHPDKRRKLGLYEKYQRAKTRSTHMKIHWKIARVIQKDWNISIGEARRAATHYARGVELVYSEHRHIYKAEVFDMEGERTFFMYPSDVAIGKREIKKHYRDVWNQNAEKYLIAGRDMRISKVVLSPDEMFGVKPRND